MFSTSATVLVAVVMVNTGVLTNAGSASSSETDNSEAITILGSNPSGISSSGETVSHV